MQSAEMLLVIPALSYAAAGAANVYMGGSFFALPPLLAGVGGNLIQGLFAGQMKSGSKKESVWILPVSIAANVLFLKFLLDVPYETGIALNLASAAGEAVGAYILFDMAVNQK